MFISRQVLREYLAAVTRPGLTGLLPMSRPEAAQAVESFLTAYALAEDGAETTRELLRLIRRVPIGGKQVHDANLVATMLANGIDQILTFNDADLRRFGTLIALAAPQPGSVANA